MNVEVSTDQPIAKPMLDSVVASVEAGLSRFMSRLTRAEVHLKNVDAEGSAKPVECRLEVRPAGRDPVIATDSASSVEDCVAGAAEKMVRLLDSLFGRLDSTRGGSSASGLPT